MTLDILVVLGILVGALLLFGVFRVRMDLVALLVLASLAASGILTASEALSGFSSSAVVTIWAVFILGGGLARTGVAEILGRQLLRVAGQGETRLLLVIMISAAVLSAFMNNVAVAVLMLPVVMDIARSLGLPPSRLLLPLAYACLLGGLTTLIGTPPNIVVSEALGERGLPAFQLFDYTPVGAAVTVGGILFMATLGRRLLPARDPVAGSAGTGVGASGAGRAGAVLERNHAERQPFDLERAYELHEQLFTLRVQPGSALDGRPLAESRLGAALGLNVLAVLRDGETRFAPEPGERLRAGDRLLVQGTPDRLAELRGRRGLSIAAEESLNVERLTSSEVEIAEAHVGEDCPLIGRTFLEVNFRGRFGVNVLAIRRGDAARRTKLHDVRVQAGDMLLVQGRPDDLIVLGAVSGLSIAEVEQAELYRLEERLLLLRVPDGSLLVGRTLSESRLGDAFGLSVLSIVRHGIVRAMPAPDERLEAGDLLLVTGRPEELATMEALRELEVEEPGELGGTLRSERVGLVEAVLSPRSRLSGRTIRELRFRDRYGLTVLAILRRGDVFREDLRDMRLEFGDALLLYGPAERLRLLGTEPDFLVLTRAAQREPRRGKAPLSTLILAATLAPVLLGWLPIAIAAVAGAAVMVISGCLTMDEAYRDVEWRAVFLVAGMLPLGLAMERTGAAVLLSEGVIQMAGAYGPYMLMATVFLITTLGAQLIPPVAMVVLMAPIVLETAAGTGTSPHTLMMAMAMAASASFMSPIAHPANVLVMGPGGYRISDYVRAGLPLTICVFVIVLLVTPLVFPP